MMPGKEPLPGVTIDDVDGYCEVNMTIMMKGGEVVMTRRTRTEWATAKKKVKLYQVNVTRNHRKTEIEELIQWQAYDNGKPRMEKEFRKNVLITAKFYKPDGMVGSSVVDGNGIWKTWYDSGKLESEVPVVDGNWHGVQNEYDEEGKIEFKTKYVNGEEIESE